MAGRRTLNERRLTRRQVEELITSGATLRRDMTAALRDSLPQSSVYELPGDRFLLVFGELGLVGKGDVYAADVFHRFLRWCAKVEEDAKHGRQGSTAHWAYYSTLKDRLTSNIETLVAELRSRMSQTAEFLDLSYKSLDLVSEYVERIGVERATLELYDHLVAYVGEVLRSRIDGRWNIRRRRETGRRSGGRWPALPRRNAGVVSPERARQLSAPGRRSRRRRHSLRQRQGFALGIELPQERPARRCHAGARARPCGSDFSTRDARQLRRKTLSRRRCPSIGSGHRWHPLIASAAADGFNVYFLR